MKNVNKIILGTVLLLSGSLMAETDNDRVTLLEAQVAALQARIIPLEEYQKQVLDCNKAIFAFIMQITDVKKMQNNFKDMPTPDEVDREALNILNQQANTFFFGQPQQEIEAKKALIAQRVFEVKAEIEKFFMEMRQAQELQQAIAFQALLGGAQAESVLRIEKDITIDSQRAAETTNNEQSENPKVA